MRIDFHSHLLPGIDDGAKSLEQAVAMAEIAVADGISVSVLTPHHLNGVYRNFADGVREQVHYLQEHLKARAIGLTLLPGSELHLVPELPQQLAEGRALTVADRGRAALVELPVHTVPVGTVQVLGEILEQGIQPVIAHPERNSALRQDAGLLEEWVEMGCLGQVTGQSCTGQFGPAVRDASREMISRGLIHVMASDAHRDRRRVPALSGGVKQVTEWFGPVVARLLTETYPGMLIRGRPVNPALLTQALEDRPPRRSWLWRWLPTSGS